MWRRAIKERKEKTREILSRSLESKRLILVRLIAKRWFIRSKIEEIVGKINNNEAWVSWDSPQGKE